MPKAWDCQFISKTCYPCFREVLSMGFVLIKPNVDRLFVSVATYDHDQESGAKAGGRSQLIKFYMPVIQLSCTNYRHSRRPRLGLIVISTIALCARPNAPVEVLHSLYTSYILSSLVRCFYILLCMPSSVLHSYTYITTK